MTLVPEEVDVFLDQGSPVRMGALARRRSRTGDLFSFDYDRAWLAGDAAFAFDPDLQLLEGIQYPRAGAASFGIFLDSSPDRWGRVLMQRRENLRARAEGSTSRTLTEWDFLLGVHDETRLGGLRFRAGGDHRFLDHDAAFSAPPLSSLAELQAASLAFESHVDEEDHPDYRRWLSQLFAPGTSLGGARPKATLRDERGRLCIAKFPSRSDRHDVGAWEVVAMRLAQQAGVDVPETRPLRIAGCDHTTFVATRFDRTDFGARRAFVSAMTLTQRRDGELGASYLELVDALQSRGARMREDCAELFRRIVFNIAIHNTDDHLRNHGFFIDRDGVRLSPAYDLNPVVGQRELALAIDEVDATCDFAVALGTAREFGLTAAGANAIVATVRGAVSRWRTEATAVGIPRGEQEQMKTAFEHA